LIAPEDQQDLWASALRCGQDSGQDSSAARTTRRAVTASIDQAAISGVYSVLAALTKGGVNAATKSLAIEYAKKGIRVNAVAPGNIKTPMHAPETHEALGAFYPIGRLGETSDIADAILFLDSAPFITGEILHVDGGQSAGR
jgi:NAD(P)-dependent dehydrogenase (short-subunit alcohol dehydrogenase family)